MESSVFEVTLHGIHMLEIPADIAASFWDKGLKRVLVKAVFEERSLQFHAALNRWKDGTYSIMFSKDKQKELGIFTNDYFQLQLFEDTSKYGVEVPEEFEAVLLSDYMAHEIFEGLTPGKKRGIIYKILRYKNSQTRIDKSILMCENLKRGIRDPQLLFKTQ